MLEIFSSQPEKDRANRAGRAMSGYEQMMDRWRTDRLEDRSLRSVPSIRDDLKLFGVGILASTAWAALVVKVCELVQNQP